MTLTISKTFVIVLFFYPVYMNTLGRWLTHKRSSRCNYRRNRSRCRFCGYAPCGE